MKLTKTSVSLNISSVSVVAKYFQVYKYFKNILALPNFVSVRPHRKEQHRRPPTAPGWIRMMNF